MAILIVDDDPVQRRLLEGMLQKFGYEAVAVDNGDAALALLGGADGARIDCVILDLVMPNLDGLGVLARLREAAIKVPVIVQTAHGGIDNVISAMRAGAADFVVKPVGAERMQVSLHNALNTSALEGVLARMKHSQTGTLSFADIITKSANMHAVIRIAEKAAASTIPVLVSGESGVGKNLIPRAIHGSGERQANLSLRSIAAPCRRTSWSRSCSVTRRARSPARPSAMLENSSKPRAACCSWTRLASCRRPHKSSSCVPFRRVRSSRLVRVSQSRSMYASSRRPIGI